MTKTWVVLGVFLWVGVGIAEAASPACGRTFAGFSDRYFRAQFHFPDPEDSHTLLAEHYSRSLDALVEAGRLTPEESETLLDRFRLVTREMMLNAFHFGNRDLSEKRVHCVYQSTPEEIVVRISDESGKFFNGLDPNERVNRLRLRARTAQEYAEDEGTAVSKRRRAHGHELHRDGFGGGGILYAQLESSELRYEPHWKNGRTIGTTVVITFRPLELKSKKFTE